VHRVALLDRIRTKPLETLDEIMPPSGAGAVSVRMLRWMFVTGPHHDRFRTVAARLLRSRS
jgi:hypothetical protein